MLATWMLEHLASGDPDDALAGDLLEEFRAGRSRSWYWRQVFAACLVSWLRSLRARLPLLVFVLLWSMLAPAWSVFIDQVEKNSQFLGSLWQMDWPFSALSRFTAWFMLNAVFLWAGMLVYSLAHTSLGRDLRRRKFIRAFFLGPSIFLPAYFFTFIFTNIFAYPGLVISRHALTPTGELMDIRTWADMVRIPYVITLLVALWQTVEHVGRPVESLPADPLLDDASPYESAASSGLLTLAWPDPFAFRRFFGLMIAAGLVNAMIAGFVLCCLPDPHAPTAASLLMRAIGYAVVGVLAGVAGTWVYWWNPSSPFRERSPLPFRLYALVCASGWIWVPAMVLFWDQLSPLTPLVAAVGAYLLASGLRGATDSAFAPAVPAPIVWSQDVSDLFAESLYRPPAETHGYLIAFGLYAAAWAVAERANYTAAALLAFCAALFAWQRTLPRGASQKNTHIYRRAAVRLAAVALPAVFVTLWALLGNVLYHQRLQQAHAAAASLGRNSAGKKNASTRLEKSGVGLGGYQSVVLWPYPEKKQIVAPIPLKSQLLAPGTTRPLIIRFDGSYWYIQPPNKQPGPMGHTAHGTPIDVNIRANNLTPIMMDAHQPLPQPIRVARCREIDVTIENADNRAGLVSLGMLLTDPLSHQKRTLYLGEQPIVSTEPQHFAVKSTPVAETLRFVIPVDAQMLNFSEITVVILPDVEHWFVAPKIAIRQFQLFPR